MNKTRTTFDFNSTQNETNCERQYPPPQQLESKKIHKSSIKQTQANKYYSNSSDQTNNKQTKLIIDSCDRLFTRLTTHKFIID